MLSFAWSPVMLLLLSAAASPLIRSVRGGVDLGPPALTAARGASSSSSSVAAAVVVLLPLSPAQIRVEFGVIARATA